MNVTVLRRLLFWLISLPLFLLLLLLLAGGVGVSTETGAKGLLMLATKILPGQLHYGQVDGRLLGPLRVEQFRYEAGPLKVALAKGELDWQPADLFDGTLNVVTLRFDGLNLQLPPSDETAPASAPATEPLTLPDVRLPLAVTVAELQGRDIHIQPAGAPPIQVDAINLKARTETDGVTVETLEVRSPLGEVRLNGRVNPTGDYPLWLQLAWQFPTPDYGTFDGQGEIEGKLRDRLRLTHKIAGAALLELDGEVRQLLAEPAWSVKAKLDVADLKPFVPDLAGKPLTVRLDAEGVLARFRGKGEIDATVPELGPATVRFAAAGDPSAIKLDELHLTVPGRPLALSAKGDVQIAELRFNATGQWQSLVWPLAGPPQVESLKGEFTADGTPKDYRFQLAADLQGPNIPKGRWTLNGQGSDRAVRDVKLSGQTLEGTLQATADAAWAPAVSWRATLSGEGLNPGAQWKEVPGKLNLRLKTDGGLENAVLHANLLLEELAGTLSGQTVRGNADVAIQDQHLTIKALRLNAGDARLEADGSLAQRWDLRWKLDVPQLKSLVSGLSGTVASTGNLSGPRDKPVVAANFAVRNLRQGDTQVQQLRGEANVDVGGANRSQLKVAGEGLKLGGQNWKTLRLDGSGTPAAHDLKAELAGDPGSFLVALAGGLQTPSLLWQGRIAQIGAKDTVAGTWNLEKPAAVRASAKEASLDAACLSSAPTRLCLQGRWNQSGDFDGRVQLGNLTPERFKHFLPQGMTLSTSVGGEATASGKTGGALQAKAALNIAPGNLSMTANGKPVRFALNGGSLQLNTDGRTASGQAKLDLAQTGQLQATLQAQDLLGTAKLNGKLDASITDLKVVSAFAPQIQDVSGQLRANVDVAGSVPNLALRGNIRLENAGLSVPDAGLKLQNLQFNAASTGQGPLQLSGSVQSDPGRLQLTGQVDPLKPQLNLAIQGENFQALKTADLQIQISPDLKLDITQQQARIDGTVTIPRAFLRPGGGRPGAVKASDDAIVVKGRNGEAPQPKSRGMEIFAKVRVILGDDVQLETPVFKGKLKGNLLVEETPQLAPRGSGSVEVVAGNYKIFGEEIQIQRGQLQFSSSPLDNPGLDLRVARLGKNSSTGEDITAGAEIRGTLKTPKLTLFSAPAMPDPDILSYLVLGRAPGGSGGASSAESAMLFKAAGAMGLGSGALTKSLGDAVGLDSLQLDGSGSKDTSLMLGKYLTPDLYVGYGVGLLDAINTFNVKYRLGKHLMFESASSTTGTGADLIYAIER
ncbi:MAG TPA: translocation/assembly module TamB domain-containing protein [Candidatus Competibacter sp.]|nr:translocation/assembly module TamB domain-containing protein [Candidatus Competibacter sp.]